MLAHHLWDSLRQNKVPAISFIHFMQFMELNDAKTISPVSLKMVLGTGWEGCIVIVVNSMASFSFKAQTSANTLSWLPSWKKFLGVIILSWIDYLKINFNTRNCYVPQQPSSQLPVYTPWKEDGFSCGWKDY